MKQRLGTLPASSRDTGEASPLDVCVVDASGNQITSFSGGGSSTEYTEGDTDTTFTGPVVQTEGPSNTATPLQSNAAKDLLVAVNAAIPAGNNNIGDIDVASLPATPAGTNLIGRVNIEPQTGNGLSIFKSLDLDESEEEVKATAGAVYGWHFVNRTTSALYLKFYNDTAANVSVGTTVPVMTIEMPANATDHIAGHIFTGGMGVAFSAAITVAVTTGFADNDTGAPGANHAIVHVFYK